MQAPEGGDAAAFLREHEDDGQPLVYDAVAALGGSISAEHGIGALKRDELAQRKSPVALAMMRAIKRALDPQNLLNPGRVLGADAGCRRPAAEEDTTPVGRADAGAGRPVTGPGP